MYLAHTHILIPCGDFFINRFHHQNNLSISLSLPNRCNAPNDLCIAFVFSKSSPNNRPTPVLHLLAQSQRFNYERGNGWASERGTHPVLMLCVGLISSDHLTSQDSNVSISVVLHMSHKTLKENTMRFCKGRISVFLNPWRAT